MRRPDSIMALDFEINSRLRYSCNPRLGFSEQSTRDDVRRVRDLIPPRAPDWFGGAPKDRRLAGWRWAAETLRD